MMRSRSLPFLGFALLSAPLLSADASFVRAKAVLASVVINPDAPYPECHAATLAEVAPGRLVAAWFGGTKERNPDVGIWFARQEDGRWLPAVEIADGREEDGRRFPTWNPVLFSAPGGGLHLFYKVGPSPSAWWGMVRESRDGGRTWSTARRLPEGILGPVKNKPVELPDGSILCPTSEESPAKAKGDKETWTVHFERTRDFGKTWERTPPLHDGQAIQAIQPSLLFLGGNQLLALGRSRQDRVFEITSEDGGKTWGQIQLGSLPNNNSGTDAVTLADGSHLIVYNHIGGTPGKWGGKRTPLNLAASKDGRTGRPPWSLSPIPANTAIPPSSRLQTAWFTSRTPGSARR